MQATFSMLRLLPALALLALGSFANVSYGGSFDELADLVEEVKQKREETELEVLDKIAALGDREAAQALVDIYGSQGSLYIRIEVIRRLPQFDGVDGSGQLVLQHLMDVATSDKDIELRAAALAAMGECSELGKGFLEMIIESAAEDEAREQAMKLHINLGSKQDHPWYRKIYEKELELAGTDKKAKRKKKAKKGDSDEPVAIVYRLPELAFLAFEVIAPGMDTDELLDVVDNGRARVQYTALQQIRERDLKKAGKLSEALYKHPETPVRLRILAADILKEISGKKAAKKFLDTGGKYATPGPFRMALADFLGEINDATTNKKLARLVGKGKSYEQQFALRALVNYEAKGLDDDVLDLLGDEDDRHIQMAAARFLVDRGVVEAGPALEKLMRTLEEPDQVSYVMDLLGELFSDSSNWEGTLLELVKNEEPEIRNAALEQLVRNERSDHLDLVIESLGHSDWSTRLTALHALASLRDKRTVGPIIDQMQDELGRIKVEFGDILFQLTGQPFRQADKSWRAWWAKEKGGFDVISLAKLEDAKAAMELRRLKEVTNSKFFGIRIISQRVIFIIDVSGSMEENMRVQFEGGDALTRIEVARRELTLAIQGLARGALFNIVTFSSGVDAWLEGGVAAADKVSREEAEAFVSRLLPGGGTNLYESIQLAFEDPDVDTIFILSDGEPSMGEVTDPAQIRKDVALWNKHRNITINTIGIGGRLSILEWLSEDSGGQHVKLR